MLGHVLISTFIAFGTAAYAMLSGVGGWACIGWFYAGGLGALLLLAGWTLMQETLRLPSPATVAKTGPLTSRG